MPRQTCRQPRLRQRQELRRVGDPGRRPVVQQPEPQVRRARRRRLLGAVLPLPRPGRPRAGVVVRPAGRTRHRASEATLKSEYVLGQDEYGASNVLDLGGTRFPVPDQAVGRLVESAKEAKAMLDAYLVGTGAATTLKTVTPTTSLVTGYEFLTDSSTAVKNQLALGHWRDPGFPHQRHVDGGPAPTEAPRGAEEGHRLPRRPFRCRRGLRRRHRTSVSATELVPPRSNLTNSVVFSTGCHAGYNVVDARQDRRGDPARLGPGPRPRRAPHSSPGPASSTATTSSSSTASGSTPSSRISCGSAPVPSRSATPSSSRSWPTWGHAARSRACTRRPC